MKIIAFILATLSLACTYEVEPTTCHESGLTGLPCPKHLGVELVVDEDFSPEARDAIGVAISTWSSLRPMIGWSWRFGPVEPYDELTIAASEHPNPKNPEAWGSARSTNRGLGSLNLRPDLAYEVTLHVAQHELGHFLGLDHYEGEEVCLMTGEWRGHATGITDLDLGAFDALYGEKR